MPEIRLLAAEKTRAKLTVAQEQHIRKLYREALKEVENWSKKLERKENVSSILRRQYLDQMEKDLSDGIEKIGKDIESVITQNISSVSTAVVKSANNVLNDFGVNIATAYSFVPADVVQAITMGKIYDGDWTLSKAIWSNTKKTQQDIHDIIAKGVLENKSSFEIAKELEKYVNPTATKPWDWGKVYPGVRKKVDYNAQRLARTLVSHAYQQSFVRTTKDNPFFEGYRWLTANNHRVCPLCQGYAEDIHADGLPAGVFLKDDIPLDHPNGQCTLSVYTEQSTDDIVDSLLNWAHGEENEEIDKFAESLGFPISEVKRKVITSTTKSAKRSDTFRAVDISNFTSAKDIQELMNSSNWFTAEADLSGCDVESAKAIYTAYSRVFERYPQLVGQLDSVITDSGMKAYASTKTFEGGRVRLNKSAFQDSTSLKASVKKDIKLSFHPEVDSGRELESIVTHEIGHAIDGFLTSKNYHVAMGTTDKASSSVWVYEQVLERGELSSSSIGWRVGSYAKKNEREFFAECFNQGMNSSEGSGFSKEFMSILDEAMKEVSK